MNVAMSVDVPPSRKRTRVTSPPLSTAEAVASTRELAWAGQHAVAIDVATAALTSSGCDDVSRIGLLELRAESFTALGDVDRALEDAESMIAIAKRSHRIELEAQALNTLSRQPPSDRESLQELVRLFPLARSVDVQRAIAGVLIRADHASLEKPELAVALRKTRLKSPDGGDMIDVLIRQLQTN